VAEPLFLGLNWTYDHVVHNYGWAIVLITVVLTMAVFPFRLKGQKSQQKMASVQGRVKPLQDKMKRYPLRDPRRQEVQQQIMHIYQEEGINPFGGCVPMLVQLPLVYAFYRVLAGAIELRHAPWFGYIRDLSAPDPYWILPITLVIAQFWMMALMPPAPGQDATQAKLMKWLMPLTVGFFFFALPAGVNLYYLVSNLVYIAQQAFMNKFHPMSGSTSQPATKMKRRAKLA
jgi:YidC/Oxa1 family membrane protein insertase